MTPVIASAPHKNNAMAAAVSTEKQSGAIAFFIFRRLAMIVPLVKYGYSNDAVLRL
jgi:hypothetical protein